MIIEETQGDIFDAKEKYIAFAVNREGVNDSGFAGVLARKYWSELLYIGEQRLGTVLSVCIEDKIFLALVCHSLKADWNLEDVKKCFEKLEFYKEPIAIVAIGSGPVGLIQGADWEGIKKLMEESKAKFHLYRKGDKDV